MGSSERRVRQKQSVRQKILDVARELFAEQGYEAVTMRKLAERIEYTPTSIYLHFADKEALVRELASQDFAALAGEFQQLANERDPLERLKRCGLAYIEFGLRHPNHYRLMFMEEMPSRQAAGASDQRDSYEFLVRTVRDAIAAGQLRPELKDTELVAQSLWSAVHGFVSLRIVCGDETWPSWRPVKRSATLLLDTLVRGIARAPARRKRPG